MMMMIVAMMIHDDDGDGDDDKDGDRSYDGNDIGNDAMTYNRLLTSLCMHRVHVTQSVTL